MNESVHYDNVSYAIQMQMLLDLLFAHVCSKFSSPYCKLVILIMELKGHKACNLSCKYQYYSICRPLSRQTFCIITYVVYIAMLRIMCSRCDKLISTIEHDTSNNMLYFIRYNT